MTYELRNLSTEFSRLISVNGKTLSWDIDNHLEVLNDLNLGQTTFTYDALGRRVIKDNSITGDILFISHGQRVIEEYSNNGTSYELERSYVHGTYVDDLVAKIEADVSPIIHYYHSDRQYNVRGLTNSSGAIVELYAYTPYGKQTILDSSGIELLSSTVQNNYGYTGRYKDTDTGLWYFRARYFSDELGRFISRDPLGYVDGYGLYNGYFAQMFAIDPSGMWTPNTSGTTVNYLTESAYMNLSIPGQSGTDFGVTLSPYSLTLEGKVNSDKPCCCDISHEDNNISSTITIVSTNSTPAGQARVLAHERGHALMHQMIFRKVIHKQTDHGCCYG